MVYDRVRDLTGGDRLDPELGYEGATGNHATISGIPSFSASPFGGGDRAASSPLVGGDRFAATTSWLPGGAAAGASIRASPSRR